MIINRATATVYLFHLQDLFYLDGVEAGISGKDKEAYIRNEDYLRGKGTGRLCMAYAKMMVRGITSEYLDAVRRAYAWQFFQRAIRNRDND